ncbi:protein MOR1-like [Camellia sinensis]|uniref:protein MOR1-like n=1 Tax=Camellia sinensis TaxID=4442 RepID=UPI00103621B3|nr:protein MOR1-like [Camellia sinensis]
MTCLFHDKSADVRKATEVCIGEIFRVCGLDAVTKNLKDIQGPALAIVLERLKHSGAFQVAKTISMGPSLKSGSKVHEPDEHPPQHIS